MQQPTCTGLYIRDVKDAERVMHAVKLGLMPMIRHRLDEQERAALTSGCVYVWEQRNNSPLEATGQEIQRFTEGRSWGPSRAHDDFLIYYEKENTSRSSMFSHHNFVASPPLIKQTYSAYVDAPCNTQKWHLNAYYSKETVGQLRTVDHIPLLRGLHVPKGRYVCARSGARRSRAAAVAEDYCQVEPSSSGSSSGSSVGSHSPGPQDNRIRLPPLQYLQMHPPTARDPMDDEILRSFRELP